MCLWAGSIRDFHHTGRVATSLGLSQTLTPLRTRWHSFHEAITVSFSLLVSHVRLRFYILFFLTMSERVGLFRHRALLIQGQCNRKAKKLTNFVAFPTLKIVCVCAAASSIFIISRLLSNPCPLTVCLHAYRYIICRRGSFIYWFDPWLALNKGK